MSRFRLLLCLLLMVVAVAALAQPVKRVRFPSLSPDASQLAFAYQGDIWTVGSNGGRAIRLTVNPAVEQMPRWSPDGRHVAFSSNRHGAHCIFVMTADGGVPRRLTYGSGDDYAMGWTPDSRWVLFYTTQWGRLEIFKVRIDGGEPIRLTGDPMELEFFPSVSPDGRRVAYNHGGGPGSWRRSGYTGSGTADIWVADFTTPVSNARNITDSDTPHMWPMWSPDGRTIWYVGDDGTPNLWRMDADGRNKRKVTNHRTDRVRYPSISADGSAIAYEYASEIRIFDTRNNRERRIEISVAGDQRYPEETRLTVNSGITAYDADPRRLLINARGNIFMTPEAGGFTRRMTTYNGRDEEPTWKNETEFFFVTMRNGSKDIYIGDIEGNEREFLRSSADTSGIALSPDRKNLAFHRGTNEIVVMPAEGGEQRVVARGFFFSALFGAPSFSWGPDNRHIVYANPTQRGGTNVFVVEAIPASQPEGGLSDTFAFTPRGVAASTPPWVEAIRGGGAAAFTPPWVEATQGGGAAAFTPPWVEAKQGGGVAVLVARAARGTSTPQFTPDGKRVFFTANEYENSDLFVVDLVPDPPEFPEDVLDQIGVEREKPPEQVEIKIEERGIFNRMRRMTTTPDAVGDVIADRTGTNLFFVMANQIQQVPAKGGAITALTTTPGPKGGLKLSHDGARVYFVQAGTLHALTLANRSVAPRPFSDALIVNQREEAEALFNEIWWVMDRFFYDPAFHGRNWEAIGRQYRALLPDAYDRAEFYDLMLEMVNEVGASHLGVSGPTQQPRTGDDATGALGIEPDWTHLERTGAYRIAKVYPNSPADHPEMQLEAGDTILSVNGVRLDQRENTLDRLMNHTVGRRVTLEVQNRTGAVRTVNIRPISLAQLDALFYDDFVERQREMTDRYSNGRLAYVHIQGMNMPSHQQFMREVRTLTLGKEGLLIDVRYNGGGNTAHLALGMLIKEPWLMRNYRGYEEHVSENLFRGDSVELPSALLINQSSFSNAEIMAEGFRRMAVGPVVGVATPGAVIGTSAWTLFDGGTMRTPVAGAYTVDGENLENIGRKPDIHVPYDPNAVLRGEDPQVRRAVEALLRR